MIVLLTVHITGKTFGKICLKAISDTFLSDINGLYQGRHRVACRGDSIFFGGGTKLGEHPTDFSKFWVGGSSRSPATLSGLGGGGEGASFFLKNIQTFICSFASEMTSWCF